MAGVAGREEVVKYPVHILRPRLLVVLFLAFCIGGVFFKRSICWATVSAYLQAGDPVEGEVDIGAPDSEHAEEESFVDENVPFPFSDGRRAVAPEAGGVLDNARSVFAEVSAEILERWGSEYADTLFAGGMKFSDGGRLIQNKMLRAVLQQGGFLAAFTGISVTAGHDCLYEQSYPLLFNKTMGRLMAATGVRFEAINVAMGNTRTSPYSYCVDAHAGIDADIISWEMAMEVPNKECGPAASAIELFIRSATVLPRQPAVLIMDASPDAALDICGPKKNRLNLLEKLRLRFMGECGDAAKDKYLMNAYRKFGLHHIFPAVLVPRYACGDARFSRGKLFKEGKHYPKPMSWHPAPAGHLLVADILFMHYAEVLLQALSRLDKVAPDWTATKLRKQPPSSTHSLGASLKLWGEAREPERLDDNAAVIFGSSDMFMGGGRGEILPRPKWCTNWRFCDGAGNYRCANTYYPLAGSEGSKLLDMVSDRTPVLNSMGKNFVVSPNKGHWSRTINEEKPPILKYLKTVPPKGKHLPIDTKWVLVGNKVSGTIDFEFETLGVPSSGKGPASESVSGNASSVDGNAVADNSRLVVCKPDFIDRIRLNDAKGVRYRVDGVQTAALRELRHYGLRPASCVLLAAEIGVGRHTLTVEPLRDGKPYVAISHVLYPA